MTPAITVMVEGHLAHYALRIAQRESCTSRNAKAPTKGPRRYRLNGHFAIHTILRLTGEATVISNSARWMLENDEGIYFDTRLVQPYKTRTIAFRDSGNVLYVFGTGGYSNPKV